jgi:hypothetical protein
MWCILNDWSDFREKVKKEICYIATEIYKKYNDGLLPNWEDDEEIIIDGSDANNYKISVNVGNTYDNSFTIERQEIEEIRVTLDENLFFTTNDGANEIEWNEVSTDELVDIYDYLQIIHEKNG